MKTFKKVIWNKINLRQVNLNDAKSINSHVYFEDICLPSTYSFSTKYRR